MPQYRKTSKTDTQFMGLRLSNNAYKTRSNYDVSLMKVMTKSITK